MEDHEKKKLEDNTPKKLESVKNYASAMYGGGAIVGGVATGNPFLVASGVVSLFGGFLSPFMAKNRDKYFDFLKSDLDKISAKVDGLTIEKILSDGTVLSAILQVYPTVIRTIEDEKLELLRNVVLNTALEINIDDDLRAMYIQFVSDLTPSHVVILKFFQNPKEWLEKNNVNVENILSTDRKEILEIAIPKLKSKSNQFVTDLINRGLLPRGEWLNAGTSDFLSPIVTDMGNEFIRFVKSPLE